MNETLLHTRCDADESNVYYLMFTLSLWEKLYIYIIYILIIWGFPGGTSGKKLPANAGDLRDIGSIPGSGGFSGGGHGNPLQYSWLENSMNRGA